MTVLSLLNDLYATLEDKRAALREEMQVLDGNQLTFRPSADAWSILQVAEHLVLVEEVFWKLLQRGDAEEPLKKSLRDSIMSTVLALFFRLRLRARIPVKSVDPAGEASLQELERRWDRTRSDYRTYLDSLGPEEADRPIVRHPVAGPMSPTELVIFLDRHFSHHLRQIERIRSADGFPREGRTAENA